MSVKLQLVVASGVHQGKSIPVPSDKFLIGRDPSCQLRPASQLVSKQHCAILTQNGRVYLQDFGSTNGTILNEDRVEANSTIELSPGDRLKVGPLDFTVQFAAAPKSDSTPMPDQLKALNSPLIEQMKKAAGASSTSSVPVKKSDPAMKPATSASASAGHDDIAAMLLNMDDDGPANVPEGSTIMEMPAVNAAAAATGAPGDKVSDTKKPIVSREDSSNAASDILKKMMRRQR
jgi:predicted component of type VI protein secretion system